MSDIAQYIASENYDSLIQTVLGTEFSIKDRKDILKYIKRKNAMGTISTETLYKLRVSCGDLSDVTRYYKLTSDDYDSGLDRRARDEYRSLLSFCPIQIIYQEASDILFNDNCFADELHSIPFNAGLHPAICDFDIAQKIFEKLHESKTESIKYNLGQYLILSMIYNFSDKAVEFNKLALSKPELKFWYLDICSTIFDKRRNFLAQDLKIAKDIFFAYQELDVFSDEMKELVYNKACNKPNSLDALELVKMILKSGFKKITAGFNHAVGHWNEEMVKAILPYRPKLDKAMTYQTSLGIMNLLKQAAEQRPTKKKAK